MSKPTETDGGEGGRQVTASESDFPRGIPKPALRALHGAGYTHLDQLTAVTEAELLRLHGVGPKAIRLIREALDAQGKSLSDR